MNYDSTLSKYLTWAVLCQFLSQNYPHFEPNHSSVICRKKRQIFFWKKFGNSDHSDQPSCWLLLFVAVGVGTPTFAGAIIITENNLHIWSTKVHTKQQVFMEVLFVAKRSIKSAKSCGKT